MTWFISRGQHLITEHEPGANLNDVNPGIYWNFFLVAWGFYRNSHSTDTKTLISRWFGIVITWNKVVHSFGFVSGYPGSWVLPYYMFSDVVKTRHVTYRIFHIPRTWLNGAATHAAIEEAVELRNLLSWVVSKFKR